MREVKRYNRTPRLQRRITLVQFQVISSSSVARMEVDCNLKKMASFFKFFLCMLRSH